MPRLRRRDTAGDEERARQAATARQMAAYAAALGADKGGSGYIIEAKALEAGLSPEVLLSAAPSCYGGALGAIDLDSPDVVEQLKAYMNRPPSRSYMPSPISAPNEASYSE